MRAAQGEPCPSILALYAGRQPIEAYRIDDRRLELYASRGWFATPFDRIGRPFRIGTRLELTRLAVEVRGVDGAGAPTRARFTFDQPDPGLAFWYWEGKELKRWTLPAIGARALIPAAASF